MASKDLLILGKMRAAGVPPHAYSTSLKLEKQNTLAAIVETGRHNLGAAGWESFLLTNSSARVNTVTKTCAVMAKELVLKGVSVKYMMLAELMVHARAILSHTEEPIRRHGYIVIGDLGPNIQDWPPHEWQTAQYILLSHVSDGGGLVVGLSDSPDTVGALFAWDFAQMLAGLTPISVG